MGATIQKRNFFSATVAHPGGAVTLAALKRLLGWGFVMDSNNVATAQTSADSFMSSSGSLIPQTDDVYVGHDSFVSSAAAAGPPVLYRGSKAAAGQPYSLTDYFRGPVDDNTVYVYSAAGQDIEVITLGI